MAFVRQSRSFGADKRVPWGGASGDADIIILGLDWSEGVYALELRPEPGGQSAPLVSLGMASAGAQGISVSYDAGYLHPKTGAVVGATIIRQQINETTLEGLAYGADPSDPVLLAYDIHATVPGRGKFVLIAGSFTIFPGVTL
jgi:hypothetical protein